MRQRQEKRIRSLLMQRRLELVRRRHVSLLLERSLDVPAIGDEVDASVKDQQRHLVHRLEEHEYDELRMVQQALQRLDAGEYGKCERCGHNIRTKRLLAFPETTLCLACASDRSFAVPHPAAMILEPHSA